MFYRMFSAPFKPFFILYFIEISTISMDVYLSTYLSLTIWLNFLISRLLSCVANSSASYSSLSLLFILCTGTVCSCDCTLISLREILISSYSFLYRFVLDGNALSLMKLSFLESAISPLQPWSLLFHSHSHKVYLLLSHSQSASPQKTPFLSTAWMKAVITKQGMDRQPQSQGTLS